MVNICNYNCLNVLLKIQWIFVASLKRFVITNFKGTCSPVKFLKWYIVRVTLVTPSLHELHRQSQLSRRGCHSWEWQVHPFAFCGRFGAASTVLFNTGSAES